MATRVAPRVHAVAPEHEGASRALARGDRLGRYELLFPIAAGGMGEVWAAEQHGQLGFRRLVAIKVIRRELAADAEARRMFLREAEVASRIRHVNVVETVDLGVEGETVFLAMPFVMGVPLSAIVKDARGGIPIPIVLAIAIGMLRGLQAAHELADERTGAPLHLVHRDVSPHNVLVGADGIAKLADFGIAHALGADDRAALEGKPRYVAPEQLDGSAPTQASDVFSAGAVLWEALAGEPLFGVATTALGFAARRAARVRALREVACVPEAIEKVTMRALAARPSERFESAKAMADALERAAPSIATHAAVAEWLEQTCGARLRATRDAVRRGEPVVVAGDADAATRTVDAATVVDTVVLEPRPRPPPRPRKAVLLALAVSVVVAATVVATRAGTERSEAPKVEAPPAATSAAADVPAEISRDPEPSRPAAPPKRTAPKPSARPAAVGAKPLFESPYK